MKKENNAGITLIALTITIVLLLILAGTAIYSGNDVLKTANQTKFNTELKILQTYINNWHEELAPVNKNSENYDAEFTTNINTKLTEAGINIVLANSDTKASSTLSILQSKLKDTTYSNKTNFIILSKEDLQKLKIENVEQKVLINIKDTKVVSYEGFYTGEGKKIYTLEEGNQVYNVKYEPNS